MAADEAPVPVPVPVLARQFVVQLPKRPGGSLTGDLYHYTSSEVAINSILLNGTLRLSPFESTNDLWESRPLSPHLSFHEDDAALMYEEGFDAGLWHEIDRVLRLHTKVACLTQDFTLPDEVVDRDARRGWAHLALWAHYGAGHAGVCLRFDRAALIEAFRAHAGADDLALHGPVRYLDSQNVPYIKGLDVGQIREFGVDAVARIYAEDDKESLYFSKHTDWSNEEEYRLVLLNDSTLPEHIDIRKALTGVVMGEAFPAYRLPALEEALASYPGVEVSQAQYVSRMFRCRTVNLATLVRNAAKGNQVNEPRRAGNLSARTAALRQAEAEAKRLRAEAEPAAMEHTAAFDECIEMLRQEAATVPDAVVTVRQQTHAVPVEQRSRKPGVTGERVHLERGAMCILASTPGQSWELVGASAVQVLDDGAVRLHATVYSRRYRQGESGDREHWRGTCTLAASDDGTARGDLIEQMKIAFRSALVELKEVCKTLS